MPISVASWLWNGKRERQRRWRKGGGARRRSKGKGKGVRVKWLRSTMAPWKNCMNWMQCKTFSLRLNWTAAGHEHTHRHKHTHTFNCNWHTDSYKVDPQSRSTATVVSVSVSVFIAVVVIVIILCHISAISASQFAEFRAHLFLFGGCRLLSARGSNYWQHLARTSMPPLPPTISSPTALFLSKFAYLKLSKFRFAFCLISLWFLWFFLTYYRFNFPLPFHSFFSALFL